MTTESGWQHLCFECSERVEKDHEYCLGCGKPVLVTFAEEMVKVRNEPDGRSSMPEEWYEVKDTHPGFFYAWHILNVSPLLAFYVLAYVMMRRYTDATDERDWIFGESTYWGVGFGIALIVVVWFQFRLLEWMNWFHRTRVLSAKSATTG